MIKNLFIPETVAGIRIFSKRVIGIAVQPTEITVTQIFFSRSLVTIEKITTVQMPFYHNEQQKYIEDALKELLSQIPKSATLITSIPDNAVIFKLLQLPFNDTDKIALVLGYELEQFLPFLKTDALSDFIITKKAPDSQKTTVMSGTVQKSVIFAHLATFSQASINPDIITIGSLACVDLYKQYLGEKTGCFVVIEMHEVSIYYFQNGSLASIRILKEGFYQVLNQVAKETGASIQEVYRYTTTDEMESPVPRFNTEYQRAVRLLLNTIALTIQSCTPTDDAQARIAEVFLAGTVAEKIPSLALLFEEIVHIKCSRIDPLRVLDAAHINYSKVSVRLGQLSSIAIAASCYFQPHLNLRKDEFAQKNSSLLLKQLSIGLILCIAIFGVMISHYTYQINRLKKEITDSSQEIVAVLKEQFKIAQDENDLQDILELADQAIIKEQETWFAFSYANQSRFLQYLLELTHKIDKKSLGFVPEKITIVEGTLTLKARVKDFEALKLLEKELRSSDLFVAIEPQDTPQFTMKITLAPTNQESS